MTEAKPIRADAGSGGDWIKQGQWDLHGLDSPEAVRAHLEAVGMSVADFKKLTVYRYNVDRLPWLSDL